MNENKIWEIAKGNKILELSFKKYELIEELKRNENAPTHVIDRYLEEIQAVEDERRLLKMG